MSDLADDRIAPAPLLVVVTGMPGAGKTTLARALAVDLALPVVAKDDIKEQLYDTLGTGDVKWSQRLGSAAYSLIFVVLRELLSAGRSVLADANFFAGRHEQDFLALPRHRPVQIHCHAPLDVLLERFRSRVDRHAGHLDHERAVELADRLRSGAHSPLALDGEVVQVDTSGPVDIVGLSARLRSLVREQPGATIPAP